MSDEHKAAIIGSIGSQNYLAVNRMLIKILGINAAVYISELCNWYLYFYNKDMLTEDGMFYITHDKIERRTTLTIKQQRTCETILGDAGILTTVRRGMPARCYYFINEDKLVKLMYSVKPEYDEIDIEESETENPIGIEFALLDKHDSPKGNIKFAQKVKHDSPKGTNMIGQNGLSRLEEMDKQPPYILKEQIINETEEKRVSVPLPNGSETRNITLQNSSPVGQTGEDDFEDVLSPSTRKGKQSRKQFTPPSLEEVKTYCESKKLPVDAEFFYDYYNESNWVDSKGNPVLNWKLKAVTWAQKNKEKIAPAPKTSADNPTELPKNYLSACDKLGLFAWKHLTEYSDTIWELARWSKDCRCNDTFMQDNPDVYGVFAYPEEFWKSYLAFVCDMIGGTKPREGHFRLRGKTFMCWYDEMEIKGGI